MALLISENPKTIQKTFHNWWLARIEGTTTNPNTPQQSFSLSFVFVRGNRKEDGTWELSPFADDVKSMTIKDVFEFTATEANGGNTQPAQLLEGIIGLAGALAKQNGVID